MVETLQRRSALADAAGVAAPAPQAADEHGVVLEERRALLITDLRGPADDPAFLEAVAERIGARLPPTTNVATSAGSHTLLCLGPDRWWILSSPEAAPSFESNLKAALAGTVSAVTDLSHGWVMVRVRGPATRAVLAKLCSLDLHPRAFKPGRCAQTELRGLPIVLRALDEAAPAFDLFFQRSYARSIWDWLIDASAEFGCSPVPSSDEN